MDKIKVVLIEDDEDWIKIIETIICNEDDMILVGCGRTQEEAIKLSAALDQIDIFLVDINLTEDNLDGIYTTLELRELGEWKIIMLTSMADESIIQKAFTAGAVNYFLKKDVERLPENIRANFYSTLPFQALLKEYSRLKEEEQLQSLTPAEREVYNLVEKGYSKVEIQQKLYKSNNTIKNQIKNILKKLSVSNTKEAIQKVKNGGIVKK